MIIKKILSLAASIISLFILQFILLSNSISEENNIKSYSRDNGVLSLMYHRFNENKYPSTNIKMDMFDEQMKIIRNKGYEFYDPNNFLNKKKLDLDKVSQIYVNRGPGSFAGIRNSLSVVKAFHLANKIDYYCYSFEDFSEKNEVKYENIPKLCDKLKVEKNLINPIYLS